MHIYIYLYSPSLLCIYNIHARNRRLIAAFACALDIYMHFFIFPATARWVIISIFAAEGLEEHNIYKSQSSYTYSAKYIYLISVFFSCWCLYGIAWLWYKYTAKKNKNQSFFSRRASVNKIALSLSLILGTNRVRIYNRKVDVCNCGVTLFSPRVYIRIYNSINYPLLLLLLLRVSNHRYIRSCLSPRDAYIYITIAAAYFSLSLSQCA